MTEAEKAYAAGVVDSDGCIRIVKEKPRSYLREQNFVYYAQVRVIQVEEHAVNFLQSIWGGGIYDRKMKAQNQADQHAWIIVHRKAIDFLRDIEPYLLIKKRQAHTVFEFAQTVGKADRNADGTSQKLSVQLVQLREGLYQRIMKEKRLYSQINLAMTGK